MNKIYKIIVVVFLIANVNLDAQSSQPSFLWTKRAGLYAYDMGYGIGTDSAGNVYVAGKYEMNADFGGTIVTCAGNHDIFVAKYGPGGDFKWVRTAGGISGDYARALSCDRAGNVYITGEIEMDCDFGSGVILHSYGDNDIFVAKYNTYGDLQWAKIGGSYGSDRGFGITHTKGGVYVTGGFRGTAVFNGNITITSEGALDIFIAKYTTEGVFQWVKTAGGAGGDDEGCAISHDPLGNIYVTGYFYGKANFSGTSITGRGETDAFIAKYNSDGGLLWVKNIGGSGNDYGRGITVDKSYRVFLTGEFRNKSYFGPISLTASGSNADIFILCYNSSGDAVWAQKAGGGFDDIGRAITVDPASNIYITGICGSTANFGTTTISGIDTTEIYFASYDSTGNFRWVLKAEGGSDLEPGFPEMGLSICSDQWSNIYASGDYRGNSAFGSEILNTWANTDIFITKIGKPITKPNATIITPTIGTVYHAGDTINFSGNDTDNKDGNLPANDFNWKVEHPNAAIGNYSITAKVTDSGSNTAISSLINLTVNSSNQLITTISSPSNNSNFNVGSTINIQAIASGDTGSIQKVEFFENATKIGESLISPYGFLWSNVAAGNYLFTAKSTDNGNNTAMSEAVNITVSNPPVVTINYPSNNIVYPSPSNITINANVTSDGASITKVEFYQGTTKIGEDLTAPFSYTWMNVTAGNYSLKAIAIDNNNQTGTSQIINTIVTTCSTPIITPLGPTTMCSGFVTLQSNTGLGFIYQWKKDGVDIIGATNSSYTAMLSGSYQVKIIQGSCISWSAPTSVKIQSGLSAIIAIGGPSTFCSGGNVKLFANTCSEYTYQWKKDGSYITGATAATYTAISSGNYQVQITQAGVNAWSSLVTVTVNSCGESESSLDEETNQLQAVSESSNSLNKFMMNVYPNPNTGLFTIVINMAITQEEKVKMRIFNVLGQDVYNKEYVIRDNYIKETVELNNSLPTGIYTLQVIIGDKVENTNIILLR